MKERRSFSCVVGVSPVACGVRAARCQSRRVLGVSRVVRSHRVVRSLASSPRLSSRVVCRSHRVMRSLVTSLASSTRLSSRLVCRRVVRSLASSRRLSSRVVFRLVVHRPAARCQSRRVQSLAALLCLSALCAVTASSGVSRHRVVCRLASCVISSCVVPLLGVSRVVRSACESRPFFLSFQTRWMTFFFVLY